MGLPNRMFLPGVGGAVLILTLLFAAVAGAQDTTTPETTTSTTAADTTTADRANSNANGSNSDNFRCDLFLHVVQDNNGALRQQYRDGNGNDQLIVQRREQCLSGNVLTNTIPHRRLPFTGGMSLIGLAAIGLVFLAAGVNVFRAMMRRGG